MENTQEHLGKREEQLKRWGARLDRLISNAEKVGVEVDAARHQRVNEVRKKYQAAYSKLAECKAAGAEKWDVFKTGLDTAWSDLEVAFKKLND